ncbi:MAG TPA: hypothetical protein VMF30_02325, partial [Pirellulales bacterium]|nr:hypothetical protein [Pirellulales bacterium]
LELTPPGGDPYLSDLLEAVESTSHVPAIPKVPTSPAGFAAPRRQSRSGRAAPAASGIVKDNIWTIVTLLSGLPGVILYNTVIVMIPVLFSAGLVWISEWGRRQHGNADGLNPVDRILFGVLVGFQVLGLAVSGIVGCMQAQKHPHPGVAIGIALGMLAAFAVGWGLFDLIVYLFARTFGLGRTNGALSLLFGLTGMVLVVGLPPEQRAKMALLATPGKNANDGNGANLPLPGALPGPPDQVVNVPEAKPVPPLQQGEGRGQQGPSGPSAAVPKSLLAGGASPDPGSSQPDGSPAEREHLSKAELKELDFSERLKHAFAWNKSTTRDLLAARVITSNDKDFVDGALGRTVALDRPMTNVYFMLGITGSDRKPRMNAKWMEQKGAEGDYRNLGGEAGLMLLNSLMDRVERGAFGDWGCDVQPPQESDPRAVLFALADSEETLQKFAAQQNVDILIALNMTSKIESANKRAMRVVTLVVSLIEVASNIELWASKPLTNVAIAAARAKGSDLQSEVVDEPLEYCDQNLTLQPLTDLNEAAAREEADRLTKEQGGDRLVKLATLRVFQSRGLISADQMVDYAKRILGQAKAELFVSDDPLDRLDAIANLIPQR